MARSVDNIHLLIKQGLAFSGTFHHGYQPIRLLRFWRSVIFNTYYMNIYVTSDL